MNRLVCVLALALSGCGLLKAHLENGSKHSNQLTELSNNKEKRSSNNQQLLAISDSLREDFVVEIVPKGIFSYAVKEGFKGTASSIKMKERSTSQTKILAENSSASANEHAQQSAVKHKETSATKQSEGFRLGINFSFYLLIPILIGILWMWRKYRKPF